MSLIAWYPLTKDFKDYSTKKRHFTNYNWDDSKTSEGKFGCALDCTDTLYRINGIPLPTNVKLSEFSISCWFYLTSKSNGNLVNMGENAGFRLRLAPEGSLLAHFATTNVSTGVATVFISDAIFEINEWYNVTVVYKDKKLYTYINNSLNKTSDISSYEDAIIINTGRNTLTLGGSIYGSNYEVLKGYLNNVKIYDHALSLEEVKQDYLQPMLHYSFENPYAEPTVNISHSLIKHPNHTHVTLGSDTNGTYFTKTTDGHWYEGLEINNVPVVGGRYYTWSIDVNPNQDISLSFDSNATFPTSNGSNDYGITVTDSSYSRGNTIVPANTWTRIWQTIYVYPGAGKGVVWSTLCTPSSLTLNSTLKVYYRNSLFEEKNHPTPYVSSSREAGLIRDNSGMGNDGTIVYQREEIPIISSPAPGNGGGAWDITITENSGTYTITNFNSTDNQCVTLGKINYNSKYHYLNSLVSYEFDITLKNLVMADGKTLSDASSSNNHPSMMQGMVHFKDGTSSWTNNPSSDCFIAKRLNNGKTANGTFHICHEKKITNQACLTNASYYDLGFRFNYIKSGTITISNLHAYYRNLDTSKLTIADKSAVGTHSAYFNGKNYIDCGLVTPLEIDELTLSCWAYRDDWSTLSLGGPYDSALISSVNSGGFGFKIERCAQESIEKSINFVLSYKDVGYLEPAKSYGMAIDYTKLSSGWHLITGVATRNKATLYIDGEKVRECIHNLNKPIYNYDTTNKKRTNLLVGAEPDALRTDKLTAVGVYIDDVRLYATALSPEDVKALYNVKTKIDNKSNLYCNQLVETKSENLAADLKEITSLGNFYTDFSPSYKDGILTMTSNSNSIKGSYAFIGPYILNKYYGGSLVTNETYKYSIYVKLPISGNWIIEEERIGNRTKNLYEAGKWYKIEGEGIATKLQVNFIFYYCDGNINVGDEIQVRDFQMYRLYDENYNPGPNIKGQYKTFEIDETGLDEYTSYNTINKYDAIWLPVFHHDTNGNTVWFADEAEALHCDTEYKYSILDQLEGFRGSDGKFEFLLEYPQDLPNQYNRWKQTDNPATTQDSFKGIPSYANGYESIHIDWEGNHWGGLLRNTSDTNNSKIYCLIDGSIGSTWYWYAIGLYNKYSHVSGNVEGIPGPGITDNSNGIDNSKVVKEVNLYVRVDSKYKGATIIDKYGAEWLEVFYHDNKSATILFDSLDEAKHCNSQYKFSILDQLENFRGKDGKFEFLLEYPEDIPGLYSRWKQSDNPVTTIIEDDNANAKNIFVNGYEPIHMDLVSTYWGGLARSTVSNDALLDGDVGHGNWHMAIGQLSTYTWYNPGTTTKRLEVPGPTNITGHAGISRSTHLYVRIDNLENKNEIFRQYKRQTKTKEIIEI